VLKLANGMEVLLASDPSASAAAAAMSIQAGCFQDPVERPGLAHFHEHMLFLGTEKYPKEDEYTSFLGQHGGDSNAFTMGEYTTYYFKVDSKFLDGALDRFAQFFIKPTFTPACVEREMNAVDSESTNYSTEDGWRLLQVLKATAAESHPFSRFDVGNLSTLGADDPPKTREELIEWNKSHYQAGAMKLALIGKDSLEDLEHKCVELFGPVREGSGVPQEYGGMAWTEKELGQIIYCVPLKEARSVSVCWQLPPQSEHKFAKPELYLSHVIGHEGEGSLHDILNRRGWVDSLSAGSSHAHTDGQLFGVNVSLTPEGDENREAVVALLYEYVDMIRKAGPQDETYKEIAALQEIAFSHKEDSPAPDDYAANAAMSLFKYPGKEVLRGPYAMNEWRPDVIQEYLEQMVPEKSLVFFTSTAFEEEAGVAGAEIAVDKGWVREEWYKAPFRKEPLTKEALQRMKLAAEATGDIEYLELPGANPFVPQDFSLRGDPNATGALASKNPLEVVPPAPLAGPDGVPTRLWHKTDSAYKSPRAYVLGHVHTTAYDEGPAVVAMMRLFCSVVIDDLNTFAYDASVAGLGYSIDYSDNLSLSAGGFSHKLPELLKVVVARMGEIVEDAEAAVDADGNLTERGEELFEKLDVQRQLLVQDYKNFTREDPWSVCSYYVSQIMLRGSWHLSEYLEVLEKPASLADMAAAVRRAMSKVQLEMMVHGNVTATEAQAAAEIVASSLKELGAEPLEKISKREVTKLAEKSTTIFEYNLCAENSAQENSCTQNVYQVGKVGLDANRDACLSLVCHVASTSCYQRLRTEEQLGYIVQAGGWVEQQVSGLCVIIQGPRLAPCEVDGRIEAWLASFAAELEAMEDEEFARNVDAVVSERTQRYGRLSQETSRHWSEIQSRRYRFDRVAKGVAALKAVTKADVVRFFKDYLAADAENRRKLSVRVLGTSAGDKRSEPVNGGPLMATLAEIRAFHAATTAFPATEPAEFPLAEPASA